MKVAEILSGPETWAREAPDFRSGRFCLAIAVERATGQSFALLAPAVLDILGLPVSEKRNEQLSAVFDWNDAPERTFDEVHAAAAEFDRRWMLLGLSV